MLGLHWSLTHAMMPRGIAIAAFVIGAQCHAADLLVPAEYLTIQSAINAATTGDVVVVSDGIYNELIRFNGKAITVRSAGGAANAIIDGGQLGTPVKFVGSESPASVLDGFTVRNGKAAVGGGTYINSASPTLRNCVFTANTALDRGGGAAIVNGQPTFHNCVFDSNLATERGGGVFLMVNSDASWTACTFRNNMARNRGGESVGGAVAAESSSDPTFNNCVFQFNRAEPTDGYSGNARGGAVWLSGPAGTFAACSFTSNAANSRQGEAWGGAIYSSTALTLTGSTFTSNTVRHIGSESFSGYGGAVYTTSNLTITGCTFASNECVGFSSAYGGAAFASGEVTSTTSSFSNSVASAPYCYGGAIWTSSSCTVNGGEFFGNRAARLGQANDSRGGAIHAPNGSVTISNASFHMNGDGPSEDTHTGGAVHASGDITCTSCEFEGNRGRYSGGAIYTGSSASIISSTLTANSAHASGGAVFASSTLALEQSHFSQNQANDSGGAVYSASSTEALDCSFLSNTARAQGGAISCGYTGTMSTCSFVGNGCTSSNSGAFGGAIHCSSGTTSGAMTDVQFIGNSARATSNSYDAAGGAIWGYAFEGFVNCEFRANSVTGANAFGGAIQCYGSNWQQCDFASNFVLSQAGTALGGAVRIDPGYTDLGTFTDCTFTNNNADGASTRGGAIYRYGYNLICTNTTFSGNSAQYGAGAYYEWAGNDYPITFASCRFEKNTGISGSGIHVSCVRRFDVSNCTFALNLAFNSGAAIWMNGNCMYNSRLSNNAFVGNIAENGGALYMQNCGCGWQIPITNCLFASNVATTAGGIHNTGGSASTPAIAGTTFCGNSPTDLEGYWQDNGSNIFGSGTDCNTNGVCDGADIGLGTSTDCNLNGVPDECDISAGYANDVNANGLPDSCEPDCDSDGIPDAFAVATSLVPDCNVNQQPDACDVLGGTSQDDNTDGVPDECQADCNANGDPDDLDISTGAATDCDGNGVPDSCDIEDAGAPDCNANGLPDGCDIAADMSADVNRNSIPDECETDCNGNGVPDRFEIKSGLASDCNGNGIPDGCDIAAGSPDVDSNGVPDVCQPDCNSNQIPDSYELSTGSGTDCNSDSLLDACEIAAGAPDININGVPDSCECVADVNEDGNVGGPDLAILLGFWGPVGAFAGADITGNGVVNGEDLAILLGRWGDCQ